VAPHPEEGSASILNNNIYHSASHSPLAQHLADKTSPPSPNPRRNQPQVWGHFFFRSFFIIFVLGV
jgi:hypothetical protein